MRLIIPVILIAALLPFAPDDDEDTTPPGEWLVTPDSGPHLLAAAQAARTPTTHPAATQPAEPRALPR
jgi:hypothetical protein